MLREKLLKYREKANLSRPKLGEILFTGEDNIYNWEIRGNIPKPSSICDYGLALDLSMDYILEHNVSKYNKTIGFDRQKNFFGFIPKTDNQNELMKKITSLTDEQQKLILAILNGSKLFKE